MITIIVSLCCHEWSVWHHFRFLSKLQSKMWNCRFTQHEGLVASCWWLHHQTVPGSWSSISFVPSPRVPAPSLLKQCLLSLQACRCWSRELSPEPSSSRKASGRDALVKCGGVNGAARRLPWRFSPLERSAPGSERQRSTRPSCWGTRTFWASLLPTTKVRLSRSISS